MPCWTKVMSFPNVLLERVPLSACMRTKGVLVRSRSPLTLFGAQASPWMSSTTAVCTLGTCMRSA